MPEARICLPYDEEKSFEVIDVLRNAGFKCSATLCSGLIEPEIIINNKEYLGIEGAYQAVQDYTL